MAPSQPTVLISAGGTGGHIFPGLATAAALRAAAPDLAIEFVGTDRMEARLVPEAGWTLHQVPAIAMPRRPSAALLRVPGVLRQAVAVVGELIRGRDVVAAVGFGGYTSVPLALAARRHRLPLVVHEQNAVPGLANRLAARFAHTVALTFPQAAGGFGRARTVLVGNPVRPDLLAGFAADGDTSGAAPARSADAIAAGRRARRAEACERFGLEPERTTLLVFGGSQGAKRINHALTGSAGRWRDPSVLQILHAAGAATFEETAAAWRTATTEGLLVSCHEFIADMHLAYAAADLVVCRGGASSIAEVTALGLPSLLVPYPYGRADEQDANARSVAAAGGAIVVDDAELDSDRLLSVVEPLLAEPERLAELAAGAASFGRPHAADELARIVLDAAGLTPHETPE